MIDLYSMNESGPVAFEQDGRFTLLQPRLYVEILDAEGAACLPGVLGEVVLSGGLNPFLPLLRYRTNDTASLTFNGAQPVLVGLEGRPPTIYRTTTGDIINNLDVTAAVKPFALQQFTLHQSADGALNMRVPSDGVNESLTRSGGLAGVRGALLALFGPAQRLSIEIVDALNSSDSDKVIQYTSHMK